MSISSRFSIRLGFGALPILDSWGELFPLPPVPLWLYAYDKYTRRHFTLEKNG